MRFLAFDTNMTTHILYKSFAQWKYDKENNLITLLVDKSNSNPPYAVSTSEFNHLLEHCHTTEIHLVSVHTGDTRIFHLRANYGIMFEYYNAELDVRLIIQG